MFLDDVSQDVQLLRVRTVMVVPNLRAPFLDKRKAAQRLQIHHHVLDKNQGCTCGVSVGHYLLSSTDSIDSRVACRFRSEVALVRLREVFTSYVCAPSSASRKGTCCPMF